MKRIDISSEGVLYRNPEPGYRAECAYLPNVVPLSETEVLCFYRIGSAFYSSDGRLALLRSADGGRTWLPEGEVWSSARDPEPGRYSYTAPHGTCLRDGSLVLIAQRWDWLHGGRPIFNPKSGGMRPPETLLFRSTDAGHSWSPPELIDVPGGGSADTPGQIIELNDGRWFLGWQLWNGWDDPGPMHIRNFAVFSDDRGRTWTGRVDFPSSGEAGTMYSHSRFTRMLDGRVAALQWTQEVGSGRDFELHLTIADATGTRWSYPQSTGIPGQTSWLADAGDGTLVAVYTLRDRMHPGIMAVMSEDGGNTWDLQAQVVLWDAVGQEYLGVLHKPEYPASHNNIAFGKPNLARLPNGELIASWWCTQACVTHARFARLVLTGLNVQNP